MKIVSNIAGKLKFNIALNIASNTARTYIYLDLIECLAGNVLSVDGSATQLLAILLAILL